MKADVRAGSKILEDACGSLFQPIFVPPWHAIPDDLSRELASLGIRCLSTGLYRSLVSTETWIANAPIHVDLSDWRRGGRFIGPDKACESLRKKLSVSRVYEHEHVPVGILSHHDCMELEPVSFMVRLFDVTSAFGARWLRGSELLDLKVDHR
jgi:hypothetical protein